MLKIMKRIIIGVKLKGIKLKNKIMEKLKMFIGYMWLGIWGICGLGILMFIGYAVYIFEIPEHIEHAFLFYLVILTFGPCIIGLLLFIGFLILSLLLSMIQTKSSNLFDD